MRLYGLKLLHQHTSEKWFKISTFNLTLFKKNYNKDQTKSLTPKQATVAWTASSLTHI